MRVFDSLVEMGVRGGWTFVEIANIRGERFQRLGPCYKPGVQGWIIRLEFVKKKPRLGFDRIPGKLIGGGPGFEMCQAAKPPLEKTV